MSVEGATRIEESHEQFIRAARARDSKTVAAMLKDKPDLINCTDAADQCALQLAAFNGDQPMMELLLSQSEINLNKQDTDGNTPMMMAAKMKQHDAIKALVAAGADINFTNDKGTTAVHFACQMGNLETLNFMMGLGAKIDTTAKPSRSGSPLHWACSAPAAVAPRLIGTLIYNYGVPIDVKDEHGSTPLAIAVHSKEAETVMFLLEHGADVNVVIPEMQSTILHLAVLTGQKCDLAALLSFGANPDAKDKDGKTPLDLANMQNNTEAQKLLTKPRPDAAKRAADAARFKAQGNKVFGEGESFKAAKFYTLAISLQREDKVYFSNRSACYFNIKNYVAGYLDACRCVALDSKFVRGYFRKASCLKALGEPRDALAVIAEGLKLDGKNSDLITLRDEINKTL